MSPSEASASHDVAGLAAYGRLYRVNDWIHFLPLPLAGWVADPRSPSVTSLLGGVLGWGFGLAYTSAINQAFDDRVDRDERRKNPVGAAFVRQRAIGLSLPPLALSLGALALWSPEGLLPGALLLAAATLYSAPPRLKRFVGIGTLWNLIVALPGFFFAARPPLTELPLRPVAGIFTALLLGSQLIHEAQDKDDDAQGGVRTVATVGGRGAALKAAIAVVTALPVIAYLLSAGLKTRAIVAGACAVFGAAWAYLLWAHVGSDERAAIKRLRLGYRYAAIALGAVVFWACFGR